MNQFETRGSDPSIRSKENFFSVLPAALKLLKDIRWKARVILSKWQNRFRYVVAVPGIFRNWWAWPLPKLGFDVILETRNGMRFQIRPGTADLSVLNECLIVNPYLSSDLIHLREDSVVVDIGASIGDFSIVAACQCPRGRVIAIEPVAEFSRMIEINKRLNAISNIEVVEVALGSSDAEVNINLAGNESSLFWQKGTQVARVHQTTLAKLAEMLNLDRIDLLKLDCEGAEWEILPSATELLPRVSQICMEFHPMNGWTAERLAAYLRDFGYRVEFTREEWNGTLWAARV